MYANPEGIGSVHNFEAFLYPPHSGKAAWLENVVGLWSSSKMCGASSGICLI